MNPVLMNVLTFVLPYIASAVVGGVLGFWIRSASIDRKTADRMQAEAMAAGTPIRTRRAPEAPVQRPVQSAGTQRPVQHADDAQARTEPLPANVRYVQFSDDEDVPMTNEEYADRFRNN